DRATCAGRRADAGLPGEPAPRVRQVRIDLGPDVSALLRRRDPPAVDLLCRGGGAGGELRHLVLLGTHRRLVPGSPAVVADTAGADRAGGRAPQPGAALPGAKPHASLRRAGDALSLLDGRHVHRGAGPVGVAAAGADGAVDRGGAAGDSAPGPGVPVPGD